MDVTELENLHKWFDRYVPEFLTGAPDFDRNILLKQEHTRRVCFEITALARELDTEENGRRIAEVSALLHDIGRFEQYRKYQTFADYETENHAELGLRVIDRHELLKAVDPEERELVRRAILHHNLAAVPEEASAKQKFFSGLLRDADKLDIWKVVTDYYSRQDRQRNGAIELDLPDTPGISEGVYQNIIQQLIVDFVHIYNLNDFKLVQVGWVFDINFTATLNKLRQRRYLDKIRAVLPENPRIERAFETVQQYIDRRLAGQRQ